jgi:thiol-disulfide isomerase/thioredoxin
MPDMRAVLCLSLCAVLVACNGKSTDEKSGPGPAPAPPVAAPAAKPPRLVAAPAGGRVAEVVAAEAATAGDAVLFVYVGASWCEPCVAFHDALTAGQLDADLQNVRFLEFDLDRDKARLEADGYTSRYVPLFALPGPDGRASGRQLQGGVKGPGAAANLVQRLQPLLAEARAR